MGTFVTERGARGIILWRRETYLMNIKLRQDLHGRFFLPQSIKLTLPAPERASTCGYSRARPRAGAQGESLQGVSCAWFNLEML